MLAVGKKYGSQKGAILLATDQKNPQKPIYWLPDGEYPLQKPPPGNPLDLVDSDWLLKNVFRKYGLKKKEIRLLTNFYKNPGEVSLLLEDSWKVKAAFKALEDRMLHVLKSNFMSPLSDLLPYHNPDRLGTVGFIAPSHAGKTYAAVDLLMRPEFVKKKVYVFSANAKTDPSLSRLRQNTASKFVFVDFDKIAGPLTLDQITPGSICLYDDVYETIPRDDPRRKWLLNFANVIMTKGRHYKKDKKSSGTGFIICSHVLKAGHESKILYTELQGGLYTFPSNSPHQIVDFLQKKIGMHRLDIKKILGASRGHRWVMFKLSKPMCAIWPGGIILL